MRKFFLFIASLGGPSLSSAQSPISLEFPSQVMKDSQSIWIQLPENYNDTTRYKMVFLLDADGHFAYTGQLLHYLAKPYARKIDPVILVGIRSKSPAFRYQYFTPDYSVESTSPQGSSDIFLSFLKTELIPEMNKRYKTKERFLVGHSLAGLFALYAVSVNVNLFTGVIAISPSLTYAGGQFLEKTWKPFLQTNSATNSLSIYISVADNDNNGYKAQCDKLHEITVNRISGRWQYDVIPQRDHYTTAPDAIYSGLLYTLVTEGKP